MGHRNLAALAVTMALLPGCFQEEAPRPEMPAMARAVVTAMAVKPPQEEELSDVTSLAKIARDDADPEVRREAVYAIADAEDPNDAALIGEALYDPDNSVRLAAIEALTGARSEFSAEWLSIALGDPDPRVRRTAVEALGEIDDDNAGFLLQQALTDVDEGVREAAQQMIDEQALARDELR